MLRNTKAPSSAWTKEKKTFLSYVPAHHTKLRPKHGQKKNRQEKSLVWYKLHENKWMTMKISNRMNLHIHRKAHIALRSSCTAHALHRHMHCVCSVQLYNCTGAKYWSTQSTEWNTNDFCIPLPISLLSPHLYKKKKCMHSFVDVCQMRRVHVCALGCTFAP